MDFTHADFGGEVPRSTLIFSYFRGRRFYQSTPAYELASGTCDLIIAFKSDRPNADFRFTQPRSQGLSSVPPLVVGRETLVAVGHVTTQNLGGKKICWKGGVTGFLIVTVTFTKAGRKRYVA